MPRNYFSGTLLANIIFITLMLSLFPLAKADDISSVANNINNYVSSHQQEQLSLLAKLVNINSGTTNIAGVKKIGELLRPEFEKLGFKVYWQEEPPNMHRAPTLIAQHSGRGQNCLLLIGHLDTVFPADSRFQHFIRHGKLATGPGIIDDKGGDIVILYALKALSAAHALKDRSITVVLTGDEEDSGKPSSISRKPLLAAAQNCNIALDFEPTVTLDNASIARRGVSNWTITTTGKEGHSSEIFQQTVGFGAIYELSRILNTISSQLAKEQYFSFSPGLILGGTSINYVNNNSQATAAGKENVVAKAAIAKGDFRYISQQQKITAEQKISAIVRQNMPGTTAVITFQDGIPAMPPTVASRNLLKKYSAASVKLGFGTVGELDPGLRGAGDISHVASIVSASLIGLGPAGSDSHSDKETLDIRSLNIQTQRAALLIYCLR